MFRRVLLIILLVSLLLMGAQSTLAYDSPSEGAVVLEEIMDSLNQYHLEKPGVDELVNGAIKGMLDTVGDPFTEYFSAQELENFANSLEGNLFGIGVELRPGDPYPGVLRVIPLSPAEKAGIQPGDIIIAVDGADLKDLGFGKVIEKIRGPKGSLVKITVDRPGKGRVTFTVARGRINLPTVDYSLLDRQTGYIYIASFGSETAQEFKQALRDLSAQGMKSLVLDLRNNGGGYLQAAVDMVSKFLPPGSTVMSIVDKEGNRDTYVTSGNPVAAGIPVAIVVNENSASAAEVLAGALRDHGKAKLVGTQTYGKGVLQTVIPLVGGGALKVTTHRYYTPSGLSLDHSGLMPDRQVIIPELQVTAAWQVLNGGNWQVEFSTGDGIVRVNEREVEYTHMPLVEAGCLFLPLRFTLEAVGYRVESGEIGIKISGYGDTLEVYPGSNKVRLNDMEKILEKPVKIIQGISYIPYHALKLLNLETGKSSGGVYVRTLYPGPGQGYWQENSMKRGII